MENLLKDLANLTKLPNDSKTQLKAISLLNEILETLKKFEKKKVNEAQAQIEDTLYNFIFQSRANSDICNRYIYYIYKYLYDFGLNSRLNDLIIKFSSLVSSSKSSINVKGTALWILGKVCCKSNYKSPQLTDLINLLIKNIKNTSENLIKNECFATLSKLIELKLPNFYNSINEILKIIYKQEKYFSSYETKCKKNILKSLNAALFYLNQTTVNTHYESIITFLMKAFEEEESSIRNIAIKIYIDLHVEKVFEPQINLQKIMRKKQNEQLKNFLEVILYWGNIFSSKGEMNLNVKIAFIQIIKHLLQKNMEYINSSENLICKIFDLLISFFQINYTGFITNNTINLQKNLINVNNPTSQVSISQILNQNIPHNRLNLEMEELYRNFIKFIYHSSYRKTLLKHIIKRLNESLNDLDKMENFAPNLQSGITQNLKEGMDKNSKKSKKDVKELTEPKKEREKYTEYHVNAMLFSLIEFTENNYDLFEVTFHSFKDISQFLLVYLISSVKSFRMLINRVLVNLAYFIPAWRIQILTLVLNFTSVAHAEVAALKNTFIYLIDENNSEYKYALIIRNNLDLLKDVANCLAMIMSTFSHKYHGITVDMSNAALTIAKNMIIGKFADEEDTPKSLSVKEKTNKFNYSNSDVDAHKEAGWIIIQGICQMDYTWLTNNFKSLFQLWKYIFSEHACNLDENEMAKAEYREALISEFFIKKAALASLRNFIISSYDFSNSQSFGLLIPKFLANALQFLIPYDKKKIIAFYKNILKEIYKEAKSFLYDCFHAIPIKLYNTKFNNLLYPVCDDLTAADYSEYSYDYIYSNLNFFDTFMCESGKEKDLSNETNISTNTNNLFKADNFNTERFNIAYSAKINTEYNSRLVNSGVNLLVEILLDNNLNMKNRQSIFKHFLTHMSELSMKQLDKNKSIKAVNIVYCLFLILKTSAKRNVYIVMDESIFASAKMILDIGFKMDIPLVRRIAAEGQGYLLKASNNPQHNINYYLTALECKFKNEINLDNEQFINTFYMIANIFRINDFSYISPVLDLYMNFIISYFNRIEDMYNPYICQSIYIITEILIKNDEIDHARKLIEVYKMNYLFINKDNTVFFKEILERNSLAEIRLLILLALLGENIKTNEVELFKLILNKYMHDEKYHSNKIKKAFLFFSKILLHKNKKLKETVHNSNFLQFLMDNITDNISFTSNRNSLLCVKSDSKISLEILIIYILSIDVKNIDVFKEFSEKLVNTLNELYNSNRNFYFNNTIINTVSKVPSNEGLIYDKNSENVLESISSFLDVHNANFEKQNFLFLDLIYGNSHLIKLSKIFLKIFFEKKYNQYGLILNLMKDIVQNQLSLYTSKDANTKMTNAQVMKSDSLTNSSENKEEKSKSLLTLRRMTKSLHIGVKKFLIKSLKHCLHLTLNNLNTENLTNLKNQHSNIFIEFLNQFMGISMILISCEECWQIRSKGVELLKEIITKFAKLKDNRTDDDSLLIQQYEAQISSCLKTIFNNSYSIFSLFRGLKMLYLHLTIPITTDNSYVKKVNSFVDSNVKLLLNSQMPTFSEKFDHLVICKKLNFFSKLYLTTNAAIMLKSKNAKGASSLAYLKTFDIFKSKISSSENFYENLAKSEAVDFFVEFFNSKIDLFYQNIFSMLNDFYVILTLDKKLIKSYKNFEFISKASRISYSHHKVLKYSQIYLKIVSMLVNDNKFLNDEFIKENQKLFSGAHSYDNIIRLIFYSLNHFFLKKLHSEEYMNNEYLIYSESDVSQDLKEKIVMNNMLTLALTEILNKILSNTTDVVKISKTVFFEILRETMNLFTLGIFELDVNLFNILECLLSKWLTFFNSNEEEILSQDENLFLIENVSKLVYFYYHNKSFQKFEYQSQIVFKLIEIISLTSSSILTFIPNQKLDEMFFHLNKILMNIFQNSADMSLNKFCATKIFPLMTKINRTERIQLVLPSFKDCLLEIHQFEKFFLLFYLILQFLTKIQGINSGDETEKKNLEEISTFTTNYLIKEIVILNISSREYMNFIFKSLMLGISQNYDATVKIILENLILYLIDSGDLLNYIAASEDLQNLILTFIISTEDKEKRRNLIHLVILVLSDSYASINFDIWKVSVYILKILSKDLEYLKEIATELDTNLVAGIDNLIKMQQIQAQKLSEAKAAENSNVKSVFKIQNNATANQGQNVSNISTSSSGQVNTNSNQPGIKAPGGGPKLKALKFGK